MKETLIKERLMAMEFIFIVIKQSMKVNGKMIIKKALEWRFGQMGLNFKVITFKVKNVGKAGFNG